MDRSAMISNRIHDILSEKAAMGMGYGGITQKEISKLLREHERKEAIRRIANICNKSKRKVMKKKSSPKKLNEWQKFVKKHKGKGLTLKQLSEMYRKGKKSPVKKKASMKKKAPVKKRGRPKKGGMMSDYYDDIFYY